MDNVETTNEDKSGEAGYACYAVEMEYVAEAHEKMAAFDAEYLDVRLVHDAFADALTARNYLPGIGQPQGDTVGTLLWMLMARSEEEAMTLAGGAPLCHRGFLRVTGAVRMTDADAEVALDGPFSCPVPGNMVERVCDGMTQTQADDLLARSGDMEDGERLLLMYAILMRLDRVAESTHFCETLSRRAEHQSLPGYWEYMVPLPTTQKKWNGLTESYTSVKLV